VRVLVAGGGAIGAATAFFLAERGAEVTLVERHEVAGAASGRSGGFLALDWCDGTVLGPLARRSFALHGELAERFDNPWHYRRLETFAVAASARRRLRGGGPALDGLAPGAVVQERLGSTATTAQVHPRFFTRGLLERTPGARVVAARVLGLAEAAAGTAGTALRTDQGVLAADAVVLALGPWTAMAGVAGIPRVDGIAGTSLVLEAPAARARAYFAQVETEAGEIYTPEIFARPDGTTYVCGLPATTSPPDDPAAVRPRAGDEAALRAALEPLMPELARAPARAVQCCYRPATADGVPRIGAVPGTRGLYLATGHGVWGMLNAPATGESLAALIVGDAPPVDLAPFPLDRAVRA